jgi:hypothetical protein
MPLTNFVMLYYIIFPCQKYTSGAGDMSQEVECLPCKHEALNSNRSIATKKEEEE